MAKKRKKRSYSYWTKALVSDLRRHSKAKTPMVKLQKIFKRSATALRSKAYKLGIVLGHRR